MINPRDKIMTAALAAANREKLRRAGKKVIFTNGCFDILHAGHAKGLAMARAMGDYLVVGLNSDSSVKRLKGPSRPFNNQNDRAYLLASMQAVDCVVIFGGDTPYGLLGRIKPDILVKGADYRESQIIGRQFAGKVARIRLVRGKSTTSLVNRIRKIA